MLLAINHLNIAFHKNAPIRVVEDFNLQINPGEIISLVGESGCGKTTLALGITSLLPDYAFIESGEIFYQKRNWLSLNEKEKRKIRGKEISFIFQEPSAYLNPCFTVGKQVMESFMIHHHTSFKSAKTKTIQLLTDFNIPEPSRKMNSYPFELSGGQLQRIMIAMALICEPKLLIADEPTTALDLHTQSQIIDLLQTKKRETGFSMLLISHDLALVSQVADKVCIMYSGKLIETGPASILLQNPIHPYTNLLLQTARYPSDWITIPTIEGNVPQFINKPQGCYFHPRCPLATSRCKKESPPFVFKPDGHGYACFFPGKLTKNSQPNQLIRNTK